LLFKILRKDDQKKKKERKKSYLLLMTNELWLCVLGILHTLARCHVANVTASSLTLLIDLSIHKVKWLHYKEIKLTITIVPRWVCLNLHVLIPNYNNNGFLKT